jgi:N-acetylmuramoyl-L-alanine amidase
MNKNKKKICFNNILKIVLVILVFFSILWAEPKIINQNTKKESQCNFFVANEILHLSLTDVFESLGFLWNWDFTSQKLVLTQKGIKLIFFQGMPFYVINDTLKQMICGAIRKNGLLYLPPYLISEIICAATKDSAIWQDIDSCLIIMSKKKEISLAKEDNKAEKDTIKPSVKDTVIQIKQEENKTAIKKASDKNIIKTIVIDPGHGGLDPGAIGPGGLEEKKVVLNIALELKELIKNKTDLKVYLTRETDKFISLLDRTRFANNKKADIFISIHANSINGDKKKESTKGYKVFFLSQAKNEEDRLVAMRENEVIKLEDNPYQYDHLQNILTDLAANEYLRESQDLSIIISETFASYLKSIPRLHLGVGQANFWVLNGAYMPSVLVEIGFISHPSEEKELASSSVQKAIAKAIFEAIINFKRKIEEGS